ncbi:MAG TPA: hypothetical protein VNA28_14480 [Solirubrobacteraceae bacterium]|nr:hypothetical protein [Solirubrobacteraceae bacterium]
MAVAATPPTGVLPPGGFAADRATKAANAKTKLASRLRGRRSKRR